jgi:dinuclear metal center YbgI/SA1388 family protein
MGSLSTMSTTVRSVVDALEQRYPPVFAADWDAIGLVSGSLDKPVRSIVLAVDPVLAVVHESIDCGADMIITHHPLFLHGVHDVAATTARGVVIEELIRNGIALYSAHTNADHALPGVSDALATALGVVDLQPIDPLASDPHLGTGRKGRLPTPMTLRDFAGRVAAALPSTSAGSKVAGDLDAMITTVGVCGGAGDSLLPLVADLDVYVTSDLRHHRAQDHLADSPCALIDVPHWAGEWPWLPVAAAQLAADLAAGGASVELRVSAVVTDPWNWHIGG